MVFQFYLIFFIKKIYYRLPPILRIKYQYTKWNYSKGAGVFPSSHTNSASSRKIQFRWNNAGDSGAIILPFVQDHNYWPRNFATLGSSVLQPPLTHIYTSCILDTWFYIWAPGRSQSQYIFIKNLQRPVFLLNSCSPLLYIT